MSPWKGKKSCWMEFQRKIWNVLRGEKKARTKVLA